MKRILFPTDFSETANNAFVYALTIADKLGAAITTVHTYDMPVLELDGPIKHIADAVEDAKEEINLVHFENYKSEIPGLRKIAKAHNKQHIELNHTMLEGDIIDGILKIGNEIKVDLIVMGTSGAGWFKEIFKGTVAGEILENAPCPVLAIPGKATFDGRLDKIAVTTEFLDEEIATIYKTLDFAKIFDADVYCVHVDVSNTHSHTQKMEKLKKDFEDYSNINYKVLEGNDLLKTLANYLEENNFDMVVMLAHRRTLIEELWNFSNVKSMSYHHKTPVMAYHSQYL